MDDTTVKTYQQKRQVYLEWYTKFIHYLRRAPGPDADREAFVRFVSAAPGGQVNNAQKDMIETWTVLSDEDKARYPLPDTSNIL